MRILVLLSRVPYPLEKGDKLRAFNQLKHLSRKHEIHLVALNDSPLHPDAIPTLSTFCASIKIIPLSKAAVIGNLIRTIFSLKPFQVGYFYTAEAQKIINRQISSVQPDVIYCQLIRMAEYVSDITTVPKVLDYMDVFSKGTRRRAGKASFFLKPLLLLEYRRLLKYERLMFSHFNEKTIISAQDRDFIPHSENSSIYVIPNGVDLEYFQPVAAEKKFDILFTGNMGYPPNVDSAVFLVKKVLPLVKREIPSARVLIAGASPAGTVTALRSDDITVTGWMDDIRDAYNAARIFTAPMQMGTGLQNKLLEAMAMKLPCITSKLAAKALGPEGTESVLIAREPEEYARLIIQLLNSPQEAEHWARKGNSFVTKHFNWQEAGAALEKVIESACSQATAAYLRG